jgi:DegV family protein with EDD domain
MKFFNFWSMEGIMSVKLVTDSSCDLPIELVQELGITVVPLYVRFGEEVYRERVTISDEEFYHRLEHGPTHPVTIQPNAQDFADVYQKVSQEADGIVSVHISRKLSGTYNSALQGKEMIDKGCPIEVIDSESVTVGLGLLDIVAAKMAKAGEGMGSVVAAVKQAIPQICLLGLVDTLKYLALGGRIGRAKALLGSVLNVKPLLTLKDGETAPAGQVRTRAKGIERLVDFVKSASDIQDLAVAYTTTLNEAQALAERLGSLYTKERITVARMGTTLGVHLGPGALVVSFRGKKP